MGNNVKSFATQKITSVASMLLDNKKNVKPAQKIPNDPKLVQLDIDQLNRSLRNNCEKVRFLLEFNAKEINANDQNFCKSIVPGEISNIHGQKKYRIAVNIEEVYKMLQIFHNFNFIEEIRKSRESNRKSDKAIKQKTPTPTPFIQEQCIICMAAKPSVVLPCAHTYCQKCTEKYITEKQDKLCPLCRKQFNMGRDTFEKQLYLVIQGKNQDEQLIKHFQQMIYDILSTHNQRQLNKVLGMHKKNSEKQNHVQMQQQQENQS